MLRFRLIPISILIFLAAFSCKKETFNTDNEATVRFSTDTVHFDTVFTTIGSTTHNFKVYNPYNKSLKISSISLAAGNNSFFRLNINGISANHMNDVEIGPNDSIYIFAEVKIDPLNQNNPLVIKDSIVFVTNGNIQDVKLVAYGQDVHLINGLVIESSSIWSNDKPYLVYNSMLVDSGVTLTVTAGTVIYFHHQSRMYVLGTLIANGTKDEPVVFRHDRLEQWYNNIPGQWVGLYFVPGSKDNVLNYCEIKNAIIGIQVDTLANLSQPTLTLSNSKILNMNAAGIYARGSTVLSYNTVIANCGQYAIALTIGGAYRFYHCTVYNAWAYSNRQTPSVILNNYYLDVNGIYQVRPLSEAFFGNCIVYGNKDSEIELDAFPSAGVFNFKFENTLLKISPDINTQNPANWLDIFKNNSPGFKNAGNNDFSLDTLAFAKDKGKLSLVFSEWVYDINSNNRTADGYPDIGAYERIE